MADNTIPSTPNPQITALVAAVLRAIVTILGSVGITIGVTDSTIATVAGAIALVIGVAWTIYEQFRQAKLRHAAAVASARGAKAVQHRDYSGGSLA